MNEIESERYDALRERFRRWSGTLISASEAQELSDALPRYGRGFRFLPRIVIAFLTILSGLLLFAFLDAIDFPQSELAAGAICIGASIWSTRSLDWRHTGAEEGWMVIGASLLVFVLPDGLLGTPEVLGLLAVAISGAAWLVRAPLFNGVAALFVCAWLDSFASDPIVMPVMLVLTLASAMVRRPDFRSVYAESSLVWIQLAFSVAAAFYAFDHPWLAGSAVAIVLLGVIALRWRDTITFWSAVPLLVEATYEAGQRILLPAEWKLMAGGVCVIGLALIIERALSSPRHGWTSRSLQSDDSDLLDIVGAVALAPSHGGEVASEGGEFGGGGATERY